MVEPDKGVLLPGEGVDAAGVVRGDDEGPAPGGVLPGQGHALVVPLGPGAELVCGEGIAVLDAVGEEEVLPRLPEDVRRAGEEAEV